MERQYSAVFENVNGVIEKVWPLKGNQKYHNYSFKPTDPEPELKKYLKPKFGNITISSRDKTPTVSAGQEITIEEMGIEIKDGYTNAFVIQGSQTNPEDTPQTPPDPLAAVSFNYGKNKRATDPELAEDFKLERKKETANFILDAVAKRCPEGKLSPEGQQAAMNPITSLFR